MLSIASFYRSDLGRKRENNEDAVGARAPQDSRQARESGWLCLVADGLGGHSFGERASRHVVQTLLAGYYGTPNEPPPDRLRRLIQQANAELYQEAQRTLQEGERMATTVVAAVICQGKLYLAHVGDSRAYLIRSERVYRLTRDHSVVGEMVRSGALSEEEARTSKLRNRLTRSVGIRPQVEVEISEPISLEPGDLILLCTDGLTQYATDRDLLASAYGEPQEIVERLIQFANTRGGSDNITVAAIRYGKPSVLPASLPRWVYASLTGGLMLLLLVAGAVLARQSGLLSSLIATPTRSATATPTVTFTFTPTLTPSSSPTSTATPTPAVTETAIPFETLTFTPAPAPILCEYIVQQDDTAGKIAERFGVPLDAVSFADKGQGRSLDLIYRDDHLLLRGVLSEVCLAQGGQVFAPTPIPTLSTPLQAPASSQSPFKTP